MANANSIELDEDALDLIDSRISERMYDEIIDLCIDLLEKNLYHKEKEILYELMDKITLLCDKTPITVKKLIPKIINLLQISTDKWMRIETLIMVERISNYQPEALVDIVELIQNTLLDTDNNVREIAINIVGNLILKLHIDRESLFFSLIRALNDDSWKVKVRALNIFEKIMKSDRMDYSLFNQFVENIVNMVGDEDEEVQSSAIEILKDIYHFMNSPELLEITTKLIFDPEWQVKEKGIWLFGEIGSEDCSKIISVLPELVNLLDNPDLMVQTKVIDAFVKIGRNFPNEIVEVIFKHLNKSDEIIEALFEIFIFLGIEQPDPIFSYIFKNIQTSQQNIRRFLSDALLKLKDEIPEKTEDQIARLFQDLESPDWRKRVKIIEILGDINFILRKNNIAVWSYIKLQEMLENEVDPEVFISIKNSIDKISNRFDDIDILMKEIKQEQDLFYQKMVTLQHLPGNIKKKMLRLLEHKEFRETSIALEEEVNKSIRRIEDYGDEIFNYQYRRLAVDLIEDWVYSRLDLLEQISDIKSYIQEKIEEARLVYLESLKENISQIWDRINVLRSEIDFLTELNVELKKLVLNGENEKAKKKLEHLAYIRDKIYRLESEIGQLWIENLDFKEELKEITVFWVQVKIEAQQLLYTISYNLKELQQNIDISSTQRVIKKDISFELLLNEFQNLILNSSRTIQDQYERFSILTEPVRDQIKKGEFDNAQNLLELTISQTNSSIEDFDKEIMNIYSQLDVPESDIDRSALVRKYLEDWMQIKDTLIDRSNQFYQDCSTEIFINRILTLQKVINPIPIKLFANQLKLNESLVLERIFSLIEKGELSGRIRENNLYLSENVPEYNKSIFISKKVEMIGNVLHLRIRLQNTTKFFFHDLNVLFTWPEFLEFQQDKSDDKWIEISDFHPEQVRVLHWVLKIKKDEPYKTEETVRQSLAKQHLQKNRAKFGEVRIIIRYKDMFNIVKEYDKRLDVLVQ